MFDTKTTKIKVGGMMCEHCSLTVRKALEALTEVKSVSVDLKKGEVSIKHKEDFLEETIKNAVENSGYAYNGLAD